MKSINWKVQGELSQSFAHFTDGIRSLKVQLDKTFYWKTKMVLQNYK